MTFLSTVLAQPIEILPGGEWSGLGSITIQTLISAAIILILVVAALIFFFMLIYGGVKYISSGGDKGQTEQARGTITTALIGLVIVFSAWAIITLINAFFGIDIFQLDIPSAQG